MLSAKGKAIAQELADMPEVQQAAAPPAIATTQDHYAYYAQVIDKLSKAVGASSPKVGHYLAAEALKLAGGNSRGIDSAMYVIYGYGDYDPVAAMLGGR